MRKYTIVSKGIEHTFFAEQDSIVQGVLVLSKKVKYEGAILTTEKDKTEIVAGFSPYFFDIYFYEELKDA